MDNFILINQAANILGVSEARIRHMLNPPVNKKTGERKKPSLIGEKKGCQWFLDFNDVVAARTDGRTRKYNKTKTTIHGNKRNKRRQQLSFVT
jgi:hypothetical protein